MQTQGNASAVQTKGDASEVMSEAWIERVYDEVDPMTLLVNKVSSATLCELADTLSDRKEEEVAKEQPKTAQTTVVKPTPPTRVANITKPAATPIAETAISDLQREIHRPCAACRKSKIRCDYKQPCSRCVRLGIGHQCAPPPEVRRGRPPKATGLMSIFRAKATASTWASTPMSDNASATEGPKLEVLAPLQSPPASLPPDSPIGSLLDVSEWPALPSRTSSAASVAEPPPDERRGRRGNRRGSDFRRTWHTEVDLGYQPTR